MASPQRRSGRVRDETWLRTQAAMASALERVTPWLLDLGNWIFGGLIAFSLVILGALITVGPVDAAVLVASAAFALALPADVAGFFLLRFAADMKTVKLEEVTAEAFVQAGFSLDPGSARPDPDTAEKERALKVIRYSYSLLTLTLLLTLVGVTATLWHMSWWIGVLFMAMGLVSAALVSFGISTPNSKKGWRSPPAEIDPKK